jgi:hypothetical protein
MIDDLLFILSERPITFVVALPAPMKITAECKTMLALSF